MHSYAHSLYDMYLQTGTYSTVCVWVEGGYTSEELDTTFLAQK